MPSIVSQKMTLKSYQKHVLGSFFNEFCSSKKVVGASNLEEISSFEGKIRKRFTFSKSQRKVFVLKIQTKQSAKTSGTQRLESFK